MTELCRRIANVALLSAQLIACAGVSPGTIAPAIRVPDSNRAEAQHLIAALAAGDVQTAEKKFSDRLRAELPPALLSSGWRSLLARNGSFRSFNVVATDDKFGKERYTLNIDFALRSMNVLVVFEPRSGEVIGLFFSMPLHDRRPASDGAPTASDPRVEEVALTVGVTPAVLGASLTLPRSRGDARLPAVLFVSGSGPQDRDETVQRAKPFRDLAFGLSARGIAGLRYDKRTFTYPAQFDARRSTVEDEVIADAVLAAGVLRTRPEVDPARVYVLGHSLGALLAPEIAKRSGGAAGLVLIAAPGRPLLEVLLEQIRSNGAEPADMARLTQKAKALPLLQPDEMLLGMPVRYWRDLDGRDEIAMARELQRPVLYVRGDRDRNVLPEDQQQWDQGLRGHVPFDAVTMPGLNHLLLPANTNLAGDVHVSPAVIERIADFVTAGAPEP